MYTNLYRDREGGRGGGREGGGEPVIQCSYRCTRILLLHDCTSIYSLVYLRQGKTWCDKAREVDMTTELIQ